MPSDQEIEEAIAESRLLISDPTPRTSRAILREIEMLKELLTQRMGGTEKAVEVAHADLTRVPTDVQKEISHVLQLLAGENRLAAKALEVHLEKFAGIERQFQQLDKRLEKSAQDSDKALLNALQAAKELGSEQVKSSKESIAKSDTSTQAALAQQGASLTTLRDALTAAINEIKARQDRMESQAIGRAEQQINTRNITAESRDNTQLWFGAAGFLFGLASLIGMIVTFIVTK